MKTWILAGAIAFAAMGATFVDCNSAGAASLETPKITEVNIGQIKGQLKLTEAQQPLWARVEAVLRAVAREQAEGEQAGILRRVGRRMVSIAFDGTVTQRIQSAAMPLLASLSEEQKATVRRLAQRLGIGDIVASMN
jgi:LTXXQ motif family protein